MTKAKIMKRNGNIIGFEVDGHSNYAEAGSDIVCAAISAVTQAIYHGLAEVVKIPNNMSVGNGYFECSLVNPNESGQEYFKFGKAQALLETLRLAFEDIANEFPLNLEVSYTEK